MIDVCRTRLIMTRDYRYLVSVSSFGLCIMNETGVALLGEGQRAPNPLAMKLSPYRLEARKLHFILSSGAVFGLYSLFLIGSWLRSCLLWRSGIACQKCTLVLTTCVNIIGHLHKPTACTHVLSMIYAHTNACTHVLSMSVNILGHTHIPMHVDMYYQWVSIYSDIRTYQRTYRSNVHITYYQAYIS